jgi:PAS domain S-box-containing protein
LVEDGDRPARALVVQAADDGEYLLANRFPLLLWWADQYCQIYNDPYQPLIGDKHPKFIGRSARECFPEIWRIIWPYIEEVLRWLADASEEAGLAKAVVLFSQTIVESDDMFAHHPASGSAPRILLAAADAEMRQYVQRLLTSSYEVEPVGDGETALAAAYENAPDLVLTDVIMPRLDGLGLLRGLRSDSRTRAIPVIMLSARAGEEAQVEGLEAGADDYLIKPFSARELLARAQNLVVVKRMRDALQRELATHDEDLSQMTQELITSRQTLQRSAEAQQQSERRWRAVYENSAVGIGLVDMSGNFLAANPVLQRMLGYTEEEFRNIALMQITPKEDRETTRLRVVQLLGGRLSEYHVEQRYVRRDGSIVWANASVSVIPGSAAEEPILVKVIEDITERKRGEDRLLNTQAELAHATRVAMIGELTASIAHEINQPLGAIVNNGDVCLRLVADAIGFGDEMREALSDIINDANRASAIVATVRALAKRATPAKTLMHFNDVVNDVLALAHRELVERQIKVRIRVAEDLPRVLADRVQFHQVLLNLVMNAIDAMTTVEEKDRILTIWGHPDKLKGKPAVLIGVQDLGKGFGAEDVDLLFEPFYTTKPRGMGMGLRISRSIVEAHGGRLWAKPNIGLGATFLCVLPADA